MYAPASLFRPREVLRVLPKTVKVQARVDKLHEWAGSSRNDTARRAGISSVAGALAATRVAAIDIVADTAALESDIVFLHRRQDQQERACSAISHRCARY